MLKSTCLESSKGFRSRRKENLSQSWWLRGGGGGWLKDNLGIAGEGGFHAWRLLVCKISLQGISLLLVDGTRNNYSSRQLFSELHNSTNPVALSQIAAWKQKRRITAPQTGFTIKKQSFPGHLSPGSVRNVPPPGMAMRLLCVGWGMFGSGWGW